MNNWVREDNVDSLEFLILYIEGDIMHIMYAVIGLAHPVALSLTCFWSSQLLGGLVELCTLMRFNDLIIFHR